VARARFAGSLPAVAAAGGSFWSRAGTAILGVAPAEENSPTLRRPYGVAALGDGLVVADPDARALFRISAAGALSALDCADHPWGAPMGVAATPAGLIFVADLGAAEVVRVDLAGTCLAFGQGTLERPVGVATSAGKVFVVDSAAHAVLVFAEDGRALSRFGSRGDDGAGLNYPVAIGAAPDGSLLVVDSLNFRVARFSPEGQLLGSLGGEPDSPSGLPRPKGVVAGADGRVYVSDAERDLVLVFHPDGLFDYALGSSGNGPSDLAMPAGLAVAARRLLVADAQNRRIQVFELTGDST
jgi:streptogramin lyase